jgi:tetratricopeptide (TPR) repeat protein
MSARRSSLVVSLVLLFASLLPVVAVAQNAMNGSGTDAYERALGDLLSQGRATSLEIFLEDHPNSPLRKDALELLVWKYQQDHLLDKAAGAARSLLRVDPENAAALAVMAESGDAMTSTGLSRARDLTLTRNTASRGLLALASFPAPRGVSALLFDAIRREVKATLDSALGRVALKSKDYLTAQIHLREAVKSTPEDVDRLYSLALAYLLATPPNNSDGMWFLARVSNLAAAQLSSQADEYGRKLSRTLYGSESDWEDLLGKTQFAAFPEPTTTTVAPVQDVASPAPSSTRNDVSGKGQSSAVLKIKAALLDVNQVLHVVPRLEITVEGLDGNHDVYSRTVITDESGTARLTLPAGRYGIVTPRGVTSGQEWYTWNLEAVATDRQNYVELTNQNATAVKAAVPQPGQTRRGSRADPIFLGIVVDTSASMGSRLSMVKNSLLASLPQLRSGEQAFLVEDGGRPRLAQGLTSDATLLQGAINRMTPNGRNALYDGVITAANYLGERAGHGTLALVIIADGVDTASRSTLKEAAAALRALSVNTYCIGTRYNDDKLHDTLTRLASKAGDEALFPRLPNLAVVSQSVIAAVSEQASLSTRNRSPASADDAPPPFRSGRCTASRP